MKTLKKLGLLLASATLMTTSMGAATAAAQDAENYPERNVEIMVGHGAGGGTDLFTRQVAAGLEEILGQSFVIINQTGGAGVVAIATAAQAPTDGYTMVGISAFPVTTAAGTNQFGLDTFTPLARFQHDTYALWVKGDSEIQSIEDFVAAVEANPGSINVGGTYSLGMDEIVANILKEESGMDYSYIPMDGDGDMHAGILGGHIDAMFDEFGPTQGLTEDESIRPILVLAEERLEQFPDVPTSVEMGWNVTEANERGFMIHKDVPEDIKAKLEEAMYEVYQSEEYQAYEEQSLLHLREGWLSSEDFTKRLEENIEKYRGIIENLD